MSRALFKIWKKRSRALFIQHGGKMSRALFTILKNELHTFQNCEQIESRTVHKKIHCWKLWTNELRAVQLFWKHVSKTVQNCVAHRSTLWKNELQTFFKLWKFESRTSLNCENLSRKFLKLGKQTPIPLISKKKPWVHNKNILS